MREGEGRRGDGRGGEGREGSGENSNTTSLHVYNVDENHERGEKRPKITLAIIPS